MNGTFSKNGTFCAAEGELKTKAFEALTLLKNCSNSAPEACDSKELGITDDDLEKCINRMDSFKDKIQVFITVYLYIPNRLNRHSLFRTVLTVLVKKFVNVMGMLAANHLISVTPN